MADVLNKQNDIDVFIEGHTDNKPINTVQFKDNWDLSVIRATSVVRILTKDYSVSSLQIQPSGRGEFMPLPPTKLPMVAPKTAVLKLSWLRNWIS